MPDTIRASFLAGYVELAREVGLDPLRMLDSVGIPRAALTSPDLRISTSAGRDLLEASSRGAEDFGLRMSELRTPSIMGPVALIIREQPTVRGILETMARYGPLHTESNRMYLEESGDFAILRLVLRYPTPGPCRQGAELSMAQIIRTLRLYLGVAWMPLSVSLVHAAPKSLATHRRIFGPGLTFDQAANEIVFNRTDLDRPNASADPEMARQITHYVEGLASAMEASLPARVLELAHALLPMGYCTVGFIARQLGVDPRTLQRQLAAAGTSFGDIVQQTRMDLSTQYLEGSNRPLAEVADLLGFSALSALSRWHRIHFGCAPSERRKAARA